MTASPLRTETCPGGCTRVPPGRLVGFLRTHYSAAWRRGQVSCTSRNAGRSNRPAKNCKPGEAGLEVGWAAQERRTIKSSG